MSLPLANAARGAAVRLPAVEPVHSAEEIAKAKGPAQESAARNRALLAETDPEIHAALCGEEARQRAGIELIPSENYTYPEVLAALGSVFTNKYAEGYPGRRYYGGQDFTDAIERLADEWLDANLTAHVISMQITAGDSGTGEALHLLIVYEAERRVRYE